MMNVEEVEQVSIFLVIVCPRWQVSKGRQAGEARRDHGLNGRIIHDLTTVETIPSCRLCRFLFQGSYFMHIFQE